MGVAALVGIVLLAFLLANLTEAPDYPIRNDWTPENPTEQCLLAKSLRESIQENVNNSWGKCRYHEDCVTVMLACPLGCFTAVNKEYADILKQSSKAYFEVSDADDCGACMYKCPMPEEVLCMGGQCVTS